MPPSTQQHRGINLFYLILAILFGLANLFAYAVWWPTETPKPVSVVEAPTMITEHPEDQVLAIQTTATASSSLPITQSTSTVFELIKPDAEATTTLTLNKATTTKVAAATAKTTTSVDRLSPTTPGGLVVRSVSYNQVVISWNPSTDNRGVAGYAIYQDSALIGTTVKTIQGFIRLSPSTKYTFGIAAFDSAGNSSKINNILVTTTEKPAPIAVVAPLPPPPPADPSPGPQSLLPPPPPAAPNLCGNSTQDRGEECDDGNTNDNDMCTNQCKAARCMDGIVNYTLEQCDDGNEVTNDYCDNQCHNHVPILPDGTIAPPAPAPSPSPTPSPTPTPPTPPPVGSFALTVTKSGSGTITSSPTGINCGATCSANYTSGTSVTLTESPSSGYIFSGWSGACTGSGTTCTVSMTAARNVTATFAVSSSNPVTYTVNVTSAGNYSPTSLTLNVGDSIRFSYTPPVSGEVVTRFTPSTVSSVTIDSEFQSRTRTFTTAGTWTFKATDHNGNTGTVTVQ